MTAPNNPGGDRAQANQQREDAMNRVAEYEKTLPADQLLQGVPDQVADSTYDEQGGRPAPPAPPAPGPARTGENLRGDVTAPAQNEEEA